MSLRRREEPNAEGPPDQQNPSDPSGQAIARDDTEDSTGVAGERGLPPNKTFQSVQSRVSSVLTVGLMTILAAGLLIYYYTSALTHGSKTRETALAQQQRRAQGESRLPPLSPFHMPQIVPAASTGTPSSEAPKPSDPPPTDSALDRILGAPPAPPPGGAAPEISTATPDPYATVGAPGRPQGTPPKSSRQLALDRKLSGPVLIHSSEQSSMGGAMTHAYSEGAGPAPFSAPGSAQSRGNEPAHDEGRNAPTLETLLRPTVTPAVTAQVLPTQRYLLPQGAFVDCTLETAISSSLPGMTTCISATDTFSADGSVVLLERGSKLTGETRGVVQAGSPRLFVLWTEARTPAGIVVPLASPGTDELGRSGLSGNIDWHWWQRFGSALLISVIDGTIQAATQRSNTSSVQLNPSGASDVISSVLRGTIDIPPTIDKAQGDRIQIFVARDVDFRTVYTLSARPSGAP
jgi:type IV secretion system protein VirB10